MQELSPTPELRLLSAAVGLKRFTVDELAAISDCKVNTARSWVRRMRRWLLQTRAETAGRGRPRTLLHLSPDGRTQAVAQLDALRHQVERNASAAAERAMLDRAQMRLELWQAISQLPGAEDEAAAELEGLRLSLGDCWRHFARLDSLGGSIGPEHLLTLAELEAAAAIVVPRPNLRLEQLARWLVERTVRIRHQDAGEGFAARAMRARIEARPEPWRATAAALAAAVWSDEGRADEEAGQEDWARGLLIAQEIAPSDRRERVEMVLLDAKAGAYEDDDTAQAVVRGLTACHGARSDPALRDWLATARWRSEFREVFAPVVVHALLDSDGATRPMFDAYRGEVLEEGIRRSVADAGMLRGEAITMSRRVQQAPLPSAGTNGALAEPTVAMFGSTAAMQIARG